MRRIDWLVVMTCLAGSLVTAAWAFHAGVVQGRKEIEQSYSRRVKKLHLLLDHTAIKADLAEGRR